MQRITLATIIIASVGSAAVADIVRVDEFSSLQFEGFQDLDMRTFERDPVSIFDGMAEMVNSGNSWLHTTGSWGLRSGDWSGQARAYEGGRMLGTTRGAIEYRFDESQRSFGGFFATIGDTADGTIRFYDGDELVGQDILRASVGGQWSWNGWASPEEFDRVAIESNYNNGGFLMHDAVRVLATAVPTQGTAAIFTLGLFVATRRRRVT